MSIFLKIKQKRRPSKINHNYKMEVFYKKELSLEKIYGNSRERCLSFKD